MDRVIEMQDRAALQAAEDAPESNGGCLQGVEVRSESGERNTGFRTQAELESELEELQEKLEERDKENGSLLDEVAGLLQEAEAREKFLEEARKNITELSRQVRESRELELQAHRDSLSARQILEDAQERGRELLRQQQAREAGADGG